MCLQPFFVNYKFDQENNKYVLDWKSQGVLRNPNDKAFKFRCRNCPECWQQDSSEWATRCYLESKNHSQNCIITLTYEQTDGELCKRDYQLFLKRLRKAIFPKKIKYFVSGEYGSLKGRPHYHMIIFGWCPEDLQYRGKSKRGTSLFNSPFLEDKWSYGFVVVDPEVSYESCFYSAKYMQKAVQKFGQKHTQEPFICMSKGISEKQADAFDPFKDDHIYIKGKAKRAPRYFFKRYRKRCGDLAYETYRAFDDSKRPRYDILNIPIRAFKNATYRELVQRQREKIRSNVAKFQIFLKKCNILS